MKLDTRLEFATDLATKAGKFAHEKFKVLDTLTIESKGHHDLVSEADRDTETLIRDAINAAYPDDGIVGEEHGRKYGTSGFDWIIDPIDGTANYLSGIPHWCVVIACAHEGLPVIGVIRDPNTDETFTASKGHGSHVNGKVMRIADGTTLTAGSIATGASGRSDREQAAALVREILINDGMYFRSASGALMLAYVASGRLLGYVEDHMNSWDCFAALLMITEAGGRHQTLDPDKSLENGTMLVAGNTDIYPILASIAERAFKPKA
ncbi:MAG: inositol monophosphatase family protein [Hyphomicrobiales bacterium]